MASAGALPAAGARAKRESTGLKTVSSQINPRPRGPIRVCACGRRRTQTPSSLSLTPLQSRGSSRRLQSRTCAVRASEPPSAAKSPEAEQVLASSPPTSSTPRGLQPPQASASSGVTVGTGEGSATETPAADRIEATPSSSRPGWLGKLPGIFQGQGMEIGFTSSNELIVGRVAMLGFGASLIGEALTGKGPLAQLKMETGIPIYEAEPLLLFFILFTLIGAVRGTDGQGRTSFRNDSGSSQQWPKPKASSIRGLLGLPETGPLFSFSTSNERFVGRVAQLGFACALIGETLTGKGALAQLRLETGIPVTEVEPLIILSIAFFFLSAINPETGRFFRDEDEEDKNGR